MDETKGRGVGGLVRAVWVAVVVGMLPAGAQAQWWGGGYGFGAGYGYGGWGWGGGWGGPFWNMGMNVYEQNAYKYQIGMLNNARYSLYNAMAVNSYAQANLMQQQALQTALENEQLADQIARERYRLTDPGWSPSAVKARETVAEVPLSALLDEGGLVRWPEVAPSGGVHGVRRAEADRLIATAYHEYEATGRATVMTANAAIRQLHAYGEPALGLLASRGDRRGRAELVTFLNNLEAAVRRMANTPAAAEENPPAEPGR